MTLPPILADLRIDAPRRGRVRLLLPLYLVYQVLVIAALVALPFALLALALRREGHGPGRLGRVLCATLVVLWNSRGLAIEVEERGRSFEITVI